MHHDTPLIATIVVGLVLAFVFGAIANRLRISPLAGYLLAGICVGPFTPGFVADAKLASELAEIGVILLMFGVGLHFSLKDLLSVRMIAIPGAIVQIAAATLMGWGMASLLGWTLVQGLIFGLALSVASTVVLLRALQEKRIIQSERGKIAVGWLIVEDLAMVLALVLIPSVAGFASGGPVPPLEEIGKSLGITLGKVAIFVALMLIVGRRLVPMILHWVAHTGSRELFRLAVLAIALGIAFGAAKLFDVSFALGAFFAGMVLAESELSQRATEETLPLRDAFAVLFFVSVGMLFDPNILVTDPFSVIGAVLIVVFGKSAAAFLIVKLFRYPTGTALTVSASLAQIGEFSFILANLAVALNLMPDEGRSLILSAAMISILLNPALFALAERARTRWEKKVVPAAAAPETLPDTSAPLPPVPDETDLKPSTLVGHAIIVGYGRVGSVIAEQLQQSPGPVLAIEENEGALEAIQKAGIDVVHGNAVSAEVLTAANVKQARSLFVAVPDGFEAGQVVAQAKGLNPKLFIIARAHTDAERDHLKKFGADVVVMGEREIGLAMAALGPALPEPEPADETARFIVDTVQEIQDGGPETSGEAGRLRVDGQDGQEAQPDDPAPRQ